jgi:hydrogenase maturation factor
MALPAGKLDFKLLEKFLSKYCISDSSVLIGPKLGIDSAVLRLDNNLLVAKTDPITFASDLIGWYAVNVNANDIAVTGTKPKWFLATILLPEYKATKTLAEKIFSQISQACKKLGVSFVGGHTEITVNLDRPIVVGCMLGTTTKKKLITSASAKEGDMLIITKGVVIEGTSIIAREKEKTLRKKFSRSFIEKAKRYLFTPGISVVKDALLASKYANAMHDPTEGGLLTGIYEMMLASNKGCLIYADRIPVLKEAKILCDEFHLNPLATISSGTLLISTTKENAEKLLKIYKRNGINVAIIGEVKEKRFGMKLLQNGKIKPLKCSARDEITKIF